MSEHTHNYELSDVDFAKYLRETFITGERVTQEANNELIRIGADYLRQRGGRDANPAVAALLREAATASLGRFQKSADRQQ